MMLKKLENISKKVLVAVLCVTSLLSAIVSTIPVAKADSSGLLGTQAALGSPILNNNFTVDNWNKWEIICWGVFLSNFCQPLIDDYESAFKTSGSGSNGSGYKALVFGSGNDTTNNEVIEAYCDYAIAQQKVTSKQIYVSYTNISKDVIGDRGDPNDESSGVTVRPATFRDFFFQESPDKSLTESTYGESNNWYMWYQYDAAEGYEPVACFDKASVPTFWILGANNNYVKVFDYMDSWDVQMISAIINAVRNTSDSTGTNYYNVFAKAFDTFWDSNTDTISMDAFGNILVGGKMLIPASVNKHIDRDEKINLINSYVMNSYSSTYSDQQLLLGLRQEVKTSFLDWENVWDRQGGYPAFGESAIGSVGLLYYDTDTVAVTNNEINGKGSTYGDILLDLFDCDITSSKNNYSLKFEIADNGIAVHEKLFSNEAPLDVARLASSILPNVVENGTNTEKLTYIVDMYGNKLDLFSLNPVAIAVQSKTSKASKEPTKQGAVRNYYNFLYQSYAGGSTETANGTVTNTTVSNLLAGTTWSDFKDKVSEDNLFTTFKKLNPTYSKIGNLAGFWAEVFDWNKDTTVSSDSNRVTLVYPVSEPMKAIAQIFSVLDGTEFSLYSTMIYMTYLDWYGIANQTTISGASNETSDFNPQIFDEASDILKVDPNSISVAKSNEDMEEEVLHMSYYMLHPEEGRKYRRQLLENSISDWIYEQYNRIVYGGYSTTYTGSVSKSNSGFLAIETYDSNWFTAWFLKDYVDIAVWIMMLCIIAIVILGLLKSKKLSWYFLSVVVVINIILIVPSTGDIVPYITSNFIQKMFASKMTYWSISEGVTNASIEKDSVSQSGSMSGLNADEAQTVLSFVKQLSVVYTDRSLMLKQDISQKVTQETTGVYSSIQSIQSARWILPMVMQQFTGDNNTTEYIYKPIANIWDDLSNMYWYYNPQDAAATNAQSPTATSGQGQITTTTDPSTGEPIYEVDDTAIGDITDVYSKKSTYYASANKEKDKLNEFDTDVHYHCYSYTLRGNASNQIHLAAYLLPDATRAVTRKTSELFGSNFENYKDADSWGELVLNTGATKMNWLTTTSGSLGSIEDNADTYNRNVRSSITADLEYLLHTENPIYYFYNVVKDCFDSSATLGKVIGQLQGEIEENAEGNKVRSNFMYAIRSDEAEGTGEVDNPKEYTGWTRDVLDLEEMFTNTVPYLYQMQLIAGGFDGESGILEGETITKDLRYYEGEKQSWIYRCNWATKLMENPDYSRPAIVHDASGNKIKINNPIMADSYPADRPMVFSEAQMHAMGLREADLNLVELKCIEVNKEVAKSWTLLINYAGTAGMTKEVIIRQMATDATLIFCEEFSSTGTINTIYRLYPQSLDLRYISFDSVMKMLVMNVSKNTSYIYGDTMSTLIEDTDIFTAAFLLIAALICAYIVPLARSILMAAIFYLGFIAVIRSLFSSSEFKTRLAMGQIISNLLFMLYTIGYFAIFEALMAISSSDEVLTTSNIQVSAGNPLWVILAVLAASILYVVLMGMQIVFCFKHYKDMGSSVYSYVASSIVGSIQDSFGKARDGITNFFAGNDNSSRTSNTNSISGTGIKSDTVQDVNIKQSKGQNLTIVEDMQDSKQTLDGEYSTNYNTLDDTEDAGGTDSEDIDAIIEAGAKMERES